VEIAILRVRRPNYPMCLLPLLVPLVLLRGGYEDAEDQEGEEGEGDVPVVVVSSSDPIRIPGPVVHGQRAVRSSGVIRSLKSDWHLQVPTSEGGSRRWQDP